MAEVMTTNEVAEELGTDPKTLRKFFRSDKCKIEPVGQGKRYAITKGDIKELKSAFGAWSTGKAKKADSDDEPKADKAPAKSKKSTKKAAPKPAAEDIDDEDIEPSDEDLADVEDLVDDLDLD